jgi:A/G-specific adenine glycosylase
LDAKAAVLRLADLSRALLGWYDASHRDLPWRRRPSAYKTLISEFMLQQTVVAAVIPYFHRFMDRFPDIRALARASEQDVLALWSGLGYYSRARNLHRAAIAVVERHGGELPRDEARLRELPGVGPYTAAAVAAIAFDARTFALDGNAVRVMARLFAVDEPINRPTVRERLRILGQELVPATRCGDFAQAVMELGACVCLPRSPGCSSCPVHSRCQALAQGRVGEIPTRQARAPKRIVRLACAAAERDGAVLLVLRSPGSLLAGTWALPATESLPTESAADAARRALTDMGLEAPPEMRAAGVVKHIFTHRDVTAEVFRATVGPRSPNLRAGRWVKRRELASMPISSFARKTLQVVYDQA